MEPLRVALCEDVPKDRQTLLTLLQSIPIRTECVVFSSGEALLEVYRPFLFDLLLLDIYMGSLTGIETAAKIRETDEEVPIAFVTTSQDFTRESYRLSALSYLEKPVSQKKLTEILELARMKKENRPALVLHRSGAEEKIPLSEILFLEQRARRLLVHLRGGEERAFYEKLSAVEPQLEGKPFFVSHKSYCVNLSLVRRIDSELRCFEMTDGSNVPIRRESMSRAKRAYEDFLFSRARNGV